LGPEQQRAIKLVEAGANVLITGPAGTGKSELLKYLRKHFGIHVTSTTGITAIPIAGRTLHGFMGCGIKLGEVTTAQLVKQLSSYREDGSAYHNIVNGSILAIDEVSMLSPDIFKQVDAIFRRLRAAKSGDDKLLDEPFGGMQLVLFGDFLQLAPVNKNWKEGQPEFIFETLSWQYADFATVLLKKIYRQTDIKFSTALSDLRVGNITQATADLLNSRYQPVMDPDDPIKPVKIYPTNRLVSNANEAELRKLPGETWRRSHTSKCKVGQESAMNTLIKDCLAPNILELKIGAQVMLLWNIDVDGGLANGSLGVVDSILDNGDPVILFNNRRRVSIELNTWEVYSKGGDDVIAEYTQYPLRLAYALTTYKVQGMTLDKVEVYLGKVSKPGEGYTGLSRAKTKEGLYIRDISPNSIKAHQKALKFYEQEEAKLVNGG